MAFKNNPRIVGWGNGDMVEPCASALEASTQSFLCGEFIYLVAGLATVCTAGSGALQIAGIAQVDATTSTTHSVMYEKLLPTQIIRIRVRTSTTDALCTAVALGKKYGLIVASNVWYLDYSNTTDYAVVTEKYVYDLAGAATYWIDVRPLASICQHTSGN